MKRSLVLLLTGMCACSMSFAASNGISNAIPTAFKTITDALANCPDAKKISFKAGLPAPGPLGKISLLTADFSAKKDNRLFSNSEVDGICPIGTKNPRAYQNSQDILQAQKTGSTPCLVMPIPATTDTNMIQDVELTQNSNGDYGSMDHQNVRCNYKYKSKVLDPDTSHPLDGFIILSAHK